MNAGRPRVWHALAILACCVLAYWIGLGATGLSMSEGHRVGVAWEWLDAPAAERDWLVTRLFERVYVRKPQGVPWALAASSAVLGQTEFAVRVVSAGAATLLALGVWWFAGRWFGWRYAWTAGCAMALLPWTWESGRAAEIEAVHNLGVGLACLGLVDLLLKRRRGLVVGAVAGVGLCVALLAKGPAAGLIVLGAALGGFFVARSWRAVLKPGVAMAIALPVVVVGGLAAATAACLHGLDEPIVAQSPGDFLWEAGKAFDVLSLLPVTLVMALPASLALLFPWGPDAAREPMRRARDFARAAAWGVLAAGVLMTIAGVSNPRYMLPVAPMVVVVVGYLVDGARGGFLPHRARLANAFMLGRPAVIALVLALLAVWYGQFFERDQRQSSGQDAGLAVAAAIDAARDHGEPVEVWADGMVEARPEVLLYAERAVGTPIRVRWMRPGDAERSLPAPGSFVLMRTDAQGDERARFAGVRVIAQGTVHKFEWALGVVP